ncbi:uncharacterized protein L3040_003505 [Drepanopeziza brunnea f. sp. 'multigermtubi']|nr:hypothetical protein L3040_003505 [Drepanopeziza brunnea f. sp. 'multigermtubi']
MSAECASVAASLTQLQSFVLQDTAVVGKTDALLKIDTFINTCRVLFSGLDDKIENLKSGTASSKPWNLWNSRVNLQLGWGEVDMQNSIEEIRGQHGALEVMKELLKIISSESNSQQVKKPKQATGREAASSETLQLEKSGQGSAASKPGHNPLGGGYNFNSKEPRRFLFDDVLAQSKAYRRFLGTPPPRIERERSLPIAGISPDEKKQPGSSFPEPGFTVNSNSDSALDRDDEPPEYSPYDPSQAPPKANNSLTTDTTAMFKGSKPETPHPTPSDRIPPTYVPVSGPQPSFPVEPSPTSITYTTPVSRETSVPVRLYNPNPGRVHFRVRTSAPKSYCVRPNRGWIEAGSTNIVSFVVVLSHQPTLPRGRGGDKFLIESILVDEGEEFQWARDVERKRGEIASVKLRVDYVEKGAD